MDNICASRLEQKEFELPVMGSFFEFLRLLQNSCEIYRDRLKSVPV